MKTFKDFAKQIDESVSIAPKAKGEADFVAAHSVEITDKTDQEKNSAKVETKAGSGKRPTDKLDNKQKFGEAKEPEDDEEEDDDEDEDDENHKSKKKSSEVKEGMKSFKKFKSSMTEADFNKQQTKMAHTIGKEFEKKGVGDESKGGPYAVATAMVRDKPDAAQKAYATIKSKMKEEADAEILFNLYNDLNEENQEFFMTQLEEDAESLLTFAKNLISE
jgi:hypothetical protein